MSSLTFPTDVDAREVSPQSPSGLTDSSAISLKPQSINEQEGSSTLSAEPKVIEPSTNSHNGGSWITGQPEMTWGTAKSGERDGGDTGRQTRQSASISVSRKKTCILKLDDCHYTIVANAVDAGSDRTSPGGASSKSGIRSRTGSLSATSTTNNASHTGVAADNSAQLTHCEGKCRNIPTEAADINGDGIVKNERPNVTSEQSCAGKHLEQIQIVDTASSISAAEIDVDELNEMPPCDCPEALRFCSIRLKKLLNKVLTDEEFVKEDLILMLQYAAKVSENIYIVETNRINEDGPDDDVLGVVEPEGVPREVRDWLTMTFTRTSTGGANKRTADDKLRFRSVAHAIRAGIVVDRIYRRTTNSASHDAPQVIRPLLTNIHSWSFDVFSLNDVSDGHALKHVGHELLHRYDIINKYKINHQSLDNFLAKMELGYSKYSNPYHNLLHGADVAQTAATICSQSGLMPWMTDLEIFAVVIATLIHDYEHTGTTNTFHVNTNSELALVYNDRAVLENYHVSAVFRLLKDEECNILSGLRQDEFREFRSLVIELVLATDMSNHFQQVKTMKSLLLLPDIIDKTAVLSLVVHCADISHPAKDWKLHCRWTEALLEEFFRQGDRESDLGLPVSPLCDRKNTMVAESQIGFIDFIVDPTFHVMTDAIDALTACLQKQCKTANEENNRDDDVNTCCDVIETGEMSPVVVSSPNSPSASHQPATECPDDTKIHLRDRWERCLMDNKTRWRERAAAADTLEKQHERDN